MRGMQQPPTSHQSQCHGVGIWPSNVLRKGGVRALAAILRNLRNQATRRQVQLSATNRCFCQMFPCLLTLQGAVKTNGMMNKNDMLEIWD